MCAPREEGRSRSNTHEQVKEEGGKKRERGGAGRSKEEKKKRGKKEEKKNVRTPEATGSLIDQSVVPRRDGFTLPTGYVPVIVLRQSRTAAHLSPSLQNKETTLISKVI